MYSYFSDLHVDLLSRGILEPGEQLIGKTVTRYMPWWAFGFINRTYLVLATDRRVILVDHRFHIFLQAQNLKAVESIPWSNVQELSVKGLFLKKKLVVRGGAQTGPVNLKMPIPNTLFGLLAPMRGNMDGARAVASAFAAQRQMGAPAQPASLPVPSYDPAQLGVFAAQPQQLPPASQQQYSQPPAPQQHFAQPMPAQNAPGYASVPPPPAQFAQQFAPQSQNNPFAAPSVPPPVPNRRSYPQA